MVTAIGPASAAEALQGPIQSITSNQSGAGLALILGLAGALWSASGYVGGFMRACAIIYETPEGRPIWKLRPLQLLVTLITVLLVALVALSLVLSGPIVSAVAGPLGLSGTAVTVWNFAKWPVMVLIVLVIITLLYYASPNVKVRGFKWVAPGAAFALVVWLLSSLAFAFYVANFGSYNKTYGTLAGSSPSLSGCGSPTSRCSSAPSSTPNAERSLELQEGVEGADEEIQLTPRDEPKNKATT
jgi:membrane protein